MKRRVIADAANVSTTNLIIAGTQFLEILVLARTLLPADLGVIALLAVILGFGRSVADLGTGTALIHFQSLSRRAFSTIYWFLVLSGIVLFGFGIAGHFLLAGFRPASPLAPYIGWIGACFLVFPLGGLYQFQFQKELRFRRMAVIEIAARCIGTATVVALALTGHGVFSYVAGQILYSGVKSLSLLIAGFGLMRPSLVFDIAEAGAVLRFGAFQMGERLVTYLAANVDYLIIGKFLGMRELGFYKIAYELVVAPLRMVNPIFGSLALPRFAKSQHDDGALREGFLATVRLLSMCTFPLLLGLCATGRVFIPVMYGPGWDRAVPIIWLLTLMGLCKILGNLSGSIIIAKGRVKVGLIWNCIIAAGNGAVFMLVVHSGVAAIAAAYSLLSIIFLVISFPYYYGSTIGLRLPEYFGSFMIPAFLSGAMAAIVFAASAALRGARLWPPGELALLVTIGIAVYAAMTFAVMGKRAGSIVRCLRARDGSSLLDLLAGRQGTGTGIARQIGSGGDSA
jgi:O-antigen/teichoic acid export membrane protein